MVLTTGKDYDYVRDEMDFPRAKSISEYQRKYPPADVGIQRLCRILEAFMGIEDNTGSEGLQDDEDDLFADLQNFPQGG